MLLLSLIICILVTTNGTRLFKERKLQDENKLSFLVTYRDFLPTSCSYDLPNSPIRDALIAEQKTAIGKSGNPQTGNCNILAQNALWQPFFLDQTIKGHPDFNIFSQTGGHADCGNTGVLPIGTCQFRNGAQEFAEIIKTTLEDNTGGIPKPVYCQPNPTDSCGFEDANTRAQTQKRFFDSWYNDDLQFNKRIAQRLDLKSIGNGVFAFQRGDDDAPADGGDITGNFFGPLARFKNPVTGLALDAFDNPLDFPAWPAAFNGDVGFWMTTELHTTFEFFSDAELEFTFNGDDDFWAFIDGKAVIDLQGIHGAQQATVSLNDPVSGAGGSGPTVAQILGLQDGEVYTLDVFHAERNVVESNFVVTSALFPACNVLQSGVIAFDFSEGVSEQQFEDSFDVRNVDRINENSFQLSSGTPFSASFLFTSTAENVGRGFIATFFVEVSGPTDGFAFVVHNRGNLDYPLSTGSTFNFLGVESSFAVVFDYCANRNDPEFADCEDQEVRVHHRDNAFEPNNAGDDTKTVFDTIVRSNGRKFNKFKVEIVYFGGRPDFLEVYLDDSLYLREKGFDIEGILGGLGGFVGVTASSSDQAADITISDFVLQTVEVDPIKSEVVNSTAPDGNATSLFSREIDADGESLGEGLTFQTFDNCDNSIDTGTLGRFVDALFIEQVNLTSDTYGEGRLVPNIEVGKVFDNLDGSYTTFFSTLVPGDYTAHAAFGNDCSLTVEDFNETSQVLVIPVVSLEGDEDACFVSVKTDAVVAIALEVEEEEDLDIDDDVEDNLTLIIATTGGGIGAIALIGAILFAWYRAVWFRNKEFVEPGANYLRELNTNFGGGDDYRTTGLAVLASQKQILALQSAASGGNARAGEIKKLTRENIEMKELLKTNKRQDDIENLRDSTVPKKQNRKRMERQEF